MADDEPPPPPHEDEVMDEDTDVEEDGKVRINISLMTKKIASRIIRGAGLGRRIPFRPAGQKRLFRQTTIPSKDTVIDMVGRGRRINPKPDDNHGCPKLFKTYTQPT